MTTQSYFLICAPRLSTSKLYKIAQSRENTTCDLLAMNFSTQNNQCKTAQINSSRPVSDVTISRKINRTERKGIRVLLNLFRRPALSALLRRSITSAARSGGRSGREQLIRMKMYLVDRSEKFPIAINMMFSTTGYHDSRKINRSHRHPRY